MTENKEAGGGRDHHSFLEFLGLGEVLTYFFRRKDSSRPVNFNIRAMHWINRISIAIFLVGVLFIILKRLL
jgi:hypothetical protein